MFRAKRIAVIVLASVGFLAPIAGAAPQSVTLSGSTQTVADTFVTNGPTNNLGGNNYGGAGALMVAGSGLGKGEFDSAIRFDTSSVKTAFDTDFGAGNWHITSMTLTNAGNFGKAGEQPNNMIFPVITAGQFKISWMQNDSWAEGTGSPASPDTTTPNALTFNNLPSFESASDTSLGTFNWDAPGDNIQRTWNLALPPSLVSDVSAGAGALTSFLYTPVDSTVGFLFNARTFGSNNAPTLTITADVPEPVSGMMLLALGAFTAARRNRRM
jgi:hypothetical protein